MDAAALLRPLSPAIAAIVTLGVTATVAVYCVGYSAFAGRPETLNSSFGWALVNVAPWVAAIELLKRVRSPVQFAAVLAMTAAVSVGAGAALLGSEPSMFEAWRRVPPLIATAAAALLLRRWRIRLEDAAAPAGPIPVPATRIDWVRAAGNYVELSIGGRTILHRTTLSAAERELGDHGFVRIHRSILVRRDRIDRFRGADVVLHDGTHLKVGKRYRSALAA